MATEKAGPSLSNTGGTNEKVGHGVMEPRVACKPQAANKTLSIIPRPTARGQPAVIAAALFVPGSVFLVSKLEAERRQAELGYCHRGMPWLPGKQLQASGQKKSARQPWR